MARWAGSERGDQAIEDLYSRLYPRLKSFIAFRVGCSQDAEDLAQDVFVELYRNNGCYDQAEDPEKYIFGIARNLIRQYHHKRAKSIKTIPIEEIGPLSAEMGREQHSESANKIEEQELTKAIEEVMSRATVPDCFASLDCIMLSHLSASPRRSVFSSCH